MIVKPIISNEQRALSRSVLMQRTLYPVSFVVDEVANSTNFPLADYTRFYNYKTFTWTPAYSCGIEAISFTGVVTPGVLPSGSSSSIACAVSYNNSLPGTASILQVDNGNIIYHEGFETAISSTTSASRSASDFRSFFPYNYYLPANSSIFIFMGVSLAGNNFVAILKCTLHVKYLNRSI